MKGAALCSWSGMISRKENCCLMKQLQLLTNLLGCLKHEHVFSQKHKRKKCHGTLEITFQDYLHSRNEDTHGCTYHKYTCLK